jgi:hypothetical protein
MTSDIDCADAPLVKVTGPSDLAQAIPYLLGFHPSRSLVLVGLQAKRVVVTARIDLDDLVDTTVLERTASSMVRGGAEVFVAIVYDDDARQRIADGTLDHAELAAEVHAVIARLCADVDEVALVSNGRLWSFDCADPQCCPPEGVALDGTSQVAAEAAYAGLVALPGRESLRALLAPAYDRELIDDLLAAVQRAERAAVAVIVRGEAAVAKADRADVRALFATARALDETGSDPTLSDEQLTRFGVALRRISVRDAVWLGLDSGRIDGRQLWRRLATGLPSPYDAAPLFLFGWASYRDGNGAMARVAADEALASDPGYTAADLILAALGTAINPRQLPKLRRTRVASGTGVDGRQERSPAPLRATPRGARRGAADRRRR